MSCQQEIIALAYFLLPRPVPPFIKNKIIEKYTHKRTNPLPN